VGTSGFLVNSEQYLLRRYQEYREDGGKKSHKSIGGGWGSNLGAGGGELFPL